MSNRLLTDADLYAITGYKQPRRQAEWLRRSGVKFLQRHDGRVAITWDAVNAILINGPSVDNERPDFSWMK